MTFWALLFLVLFLSALVAYLGDKVAKWAGKRHYRLFGLRPRQTATLVAVFTGVGIALLSYLGFLLVFRDAREVILQAEAIRAERDRLKEQRAALEAEAARALAEVNALREERGALLQALERVEGLREAASRELAALREEVARLEARGKALEEALRAREAEVKAKEEALLALEARLRGAEAELAQARKEREALLGERERLEADLVALQGRVLDLRRSREVLEEEASRLREALARVRQELAEEERRVQSLLVQARVLEGQKGQLAEGLARLSQGLYLGEVRLGPEEGPVALEEMARRRALLLGFKGVRLLGGAKGPGLAVLEGAGYEDGVLLVRARFYPEKRLWPAGEVLASATFLNTGEPRARAVLLEVGERVRKRLLEEGVPPEYARFPTETDLAQGLLLLRGRSGVVRVGVVALREVWTVEPPLLAFRLLGGPPGPEVPVPTREVR
ncbi:DUF3084 domain-containing protein [Thermus thermophilus]|uniref:DUF3084 domain-containing protein n=1 Tax=Thermus thermophilus TaxID=274 RepID=UPI001FCB1361|nr:DUF3084 domain-containing protein [Thermus thermophilus]BDG29369.1 hypothetical protein TthSNM76_15790 [Thermus thermophilus]